MNPHVMDALNRNPELMRRARFLTMTFGVAVGDVRHLVTIEPGDVRVAAAAAGAAEPAFTIAASPQAWKEYASAEPRPGFNDVIAMAESGNGQITGQDMLAFFGNLFFVKGVIAAMFKGNASW